ncbi:MAG: AraC family transcriptional regulator [Clostridia bacterium]|nr:AraC family transcriptional regulator [Clostridia bacterium]
MLTRNKPEGERFWASKRHFCYNDIHWHDYYEVELLMDGKVHQNLNGAESVLIPRCLTLLSPYDFHRLETPSESPALYYTLGFCREEISTEVRKVLESLSPPLLLRFDEKAHAALIEKYEELEREINRESHYRLQTVRRKIELMLLYICECVADGSAKPLGEGVVCTDSQINSIRAVLLHIDSHYGEEISRDELAACLHYTPNYLSTLFHRLTGTSISEYIMNVRMSHAYDLLRDGDMPIREVILKTGFRSPSLFYRKFHEYYGKNPREIAALREKGEK